MLIQDNRLLRLVEMSIDAVACVASLWAVVLVMNGEISPRDVVLAVIVFSLAFPGTEHLTETIPGLARHIAAGWIAGSGLLLAFGYLTGYLRLFERDVLVTWWWVALVGMFAAHVLLRLSIPVIVKFRGPSKRAVVVGANEHGIELARRLDRDPYAGMVVAGFFDDRGDERVAGLGAYPVLGKIEDLPRFANDNHIDAIYISLPMTSQRRILSLLDGLRDTTSSIFFVPDIFITDLIQGQVDFVQGLPVVAVRETPFTGLNGVFKRVSDVVVSLLVLVLLSPLLLIIAVDVKLSSQGPVIFRQRRCGLDGREIIVYKFRTMTVTEDGANVTQASQHDKRVTPLGAFLRRTSLDELPQFVNVLQGRMSIVGPRPHAVAHNEMYRKLISGYMMRHKVRPGITGWAQINGLRGETETVEKMKARIDFDLDYLRNWSLQLDAYIIAKTAWILLKGQKNAY
jgi:putative colanic acid biosynthesis UDP-glucose lipid carrier transferase